jgi:alkanesulfonate monooxygenase
VSFRRIKDRKRITATAWSRLSAFYARQTTALDRLSNDRLLLNVVAGGSSAELAGDGIFLDHDTRYAQADEFLTIWRRLMSGDSVNFNGQFLKVQGGQLSFPPVQVPHPPLWFGGSSEPALDLAASHVDTYLTWGEPLAQVAEKIQRAKTKAASKGRRLQFGLRIHLIIRRTEDEAWRAAHELISHVTPEAITAVRQRGSAWSMSPILRASAACPHCTGSIEIA